MDDRSNYNPGWKYNYWELRGVPIRIEIGRAEVNERKANLAFRFSGVKELVGFNKPGDLAVVVQSRLKSIQAEMLTNATKLRNEKLRVVSEMFFVGSFEVHISEEPRG